MPGDIPFLSPIASTLSGVKPGAKWEIACIYPNSRDNDNGDHAIFGGIERFVVATFHCRQYSVIALKQMTLGPRETRLLKTIRLEK